jgi:hypothetical protein
MTDQEINDVLGLSLKRKLPELKEVDGKKAGAEYLVLGWIISENSAYIQLVH